MKLLTIVFLLQICFCNSALGKKPYNSIDNFQTIKLEISKNDLMNIKLNFCDTLSIEFTGLYPITDTLPLSTRDSILVKSLLEKEGFEIVDWGRGNWEKGPRFIYLKYKKGDCICNVFKKYYFNKKNDDGFYNLRISERIICNSNKSLDD